MQVYQRASFTTLCVQCIKPKLKRAGISVHSVKVDAFTIKAENEKNPRESLDFIRQGWRLASEQVPDIKFANELYQVVEIK